MFTRFTPARFLAFSLLIVLALSACASQPPSPAAQTAPAVEHPTATLAAEKSDAAGIPNPSSVYCSDQGGTSEIRTAADGSQYGTCVFDDGSECEEWAYFRGECSPGEPAVTPNDSVPAGKQPSAEQAPAVDAAKQALASELGFDPAEISLKSVEAKDWPDACLGLAAPDQMCAQMIVPGYQVILTASSQDYTLRASQTGDVVKLEK